MFIMGQIQLVNNPQQILGKVSVIALLGDLREETGKVEKTLDLNPTGIHD